MSKINVSGPFTGQGGADTYDIGIIDQRGRTRLGYIKRVFADVYYVNHIDNPYKDNTRYRDWDAALAAIQR